MWDLEICKRNAKWSMAAALRSREMRGEEKKMKKREKDGKNRVFGAFK